MEVTKKSSRLDYFYHSSVLGLLSVFKLACETTRCHEREATLQLDYFMNKLNAALNN